MLYWTPVKTSGLNAKDNCTHCLIQKYTFSFESILPPKNATGKTAQQDKAFILLLRK